jgi:cytochrome c553
LVVRALVAGDAAAGARLAAARCASCHSSTDTTHSKVPLLEGQPKAYFVARWQEKSECLKWAFVHARQR